MDCNRTVAALLDTSHGQCATVLDVHGMMPEGVGIWL